MPNFPYTRDIPDGPNNPSQDQPDMKINTNSTDDIIDVDHYSFSEANGGLHRQVRLVNETIPAVAANQTGLYSKTAGQSQLFATSDAGAKEYQLTRMIDANIALFGTLTACGTITAGYTQNAGWTFLPGGLIFQYATVVRVAGISPSTILVGFPITFTTAASIVISITPIGKTVGPTEAHTPSIRSGTVATTGFTCDYETSTTQYVGFTWTAIGV